MSNQIKIGADLQSAKRSVLDFSNFMKKELKSVPKAEYLNPRDAELSKRAYGSALEVMKKGLMDAEKAAESLKNEMMAGNKTQAEMNNLQVKYLKTQTEILRTKKQINDALKTSAELERNSTKMGRFSGGLQQGLGGSKAAGLVGRLGTMGGLGMLAGGAALGAGAFGVARGMAAYGTYAEGIDSRQMLRGRGVRDVTGRDSRLQALGLTPEQARQGMLGATDAVGSSASADFVRRQQEFALTTGTSMEQQMGLGGQLRASVGMGQTDKTLAQLQASALASGIEGAIGPYLETAASMLTQLNDKGFTFSDDALGLLSDFTRGGQTESRASAQIMNMDQAIRGASGDTAAFLTSMFAEAGVGKGNLGAIQTRMQSGGLFGIDTDSATMDPATKMMVEGLGIGGAGGDFEATRKALTGKFSDLGAQAGGLDTATGRHYASKTMGDMMGFDPASMSDFMARLAKASSKSEREAIMKEVSDKGRTPEQIMASMDGEIKKSNALLQANQDVLGSRLAPVAIKANELLSSIDVGINHIARFFGMEDNSVSGRAASGKLSASDLRGMSPEEMLEAQGGLASRKASLEAKLRPDRHGMSRVSGAEKESVMAELAGINDTQRTIGVRTGQIPSQQLIGAESKTSIDLLTGIFTELKKTNENKKPGRYMPLAMPTNGSEGNTRR